MCSVLLSVSSCEWWLLNQFVALVYLESVLTISRHPNKVSIIIEWRCVRVCVVVSVVGWLCLLRAVSVGCSFMYVLLVPHGVLNDVLQLLCCVSCIGGRRVRGFHPPCLGFQPWENSRLMVVAVQGASDAED